MFCSGCGSQIGSGLNYCSRCGRRIAEDFKSSQNVSSATIAAYTGGAGLIGFAFLVRILSKSGVPTDQFVPIAFFYFAALVAICFLILRHDRVGMLGTAKTGEEQRAQEKFLPPVTTARLNEPSDIPISVTEHTTKALDKVQAKTHS